RIRLTEPTSTSGPQAARMLPPALPNLDFPISIIAVSWGYLGTDTCHPGQGCAAPARGGLSLFRYARNVELVRDAARRAASPRFFRQPLSRGELHRVERRVRAGGKSLDQRSRTWEWT
ncbi:hypothetical protein, partial [Streptomyces sp. NPDC005046]